MPTYTYNCPGCGAFDLLRTISRRAEPAHCPDCGRLGTRMFSPPRLNSISPSLTEAVTDAGLSSESPQVTQHIPPTVRRTPVSARRPGYPALPRP